VETREHIVIGHHRSRRALKARRLRRHINQRPGTVRALKSAEVKQQDDVGTPRKFVVPMFSSISAVADSWPLPVRKMFPSSPGLLGN
jgi:hypothetical protein